MAAGEAKNPTRTIPKAVRTTAWRIIIFYILTIFLLGLCIPSTNPNLLVEGNTASTASFTLLFDLAGIHAAAHIVNTAVLTR
jgi:amino acid permease